ncbi:MAG: hypothetical protein A2750_04320 [Candidatus Yanofskybacteria bacterium RIFCSPHIGHO2_01_FULL_45_42]|uniref:Uncharacterized protein n=2 Tax=Candidatus Yanofskyibacteriota TaxID=1752733 RepID=A0A1F8FJY8_9BACT|nr:MAG: hypothetical protein A2750_04320 [Candidatus Yanofskybacteria bacterium RIFCSPHIGHO2_01_FULL_45_42]OGN13487.1 MAG: hypothetical protein A3J47_03975 [Candidatus Yanofskybacteria bacterium RIFCSPHIGHO2_02_FULL_43_22]
MRKRVLFILVVPLFLISALLILMPGNTAVVYAGENGKTIFPNYQCNKGGHISCPKIDSSRDGKLHAVEFKGTRAEEDALTEWLDQQRSKE